MNVSATEIKEGESMTISFTTSRSVAASESFTVAIDLGEEQYTLDSEVVEISEGRKEAEVRLVAIDDDLVEDLMNGSISLINLSSGIEWNGDPISFSLESEDEEEIILSVKEEFNFSLFPNPTERFLNIDTQNQIDSVEVHSLDGRKMDNVIIQNRTIDLIHLNEGLYIIRIVFSSGEPIEKLILKR